MFNQENSNGRAVNWLTLLFILNNKYFENPFGKKLKHFYSKRHQRNGKWMIKKECLALPYYLPHMPEIGAATTLSVKGKPYIDSSVCSIL